LKDLHFKYPLFKENKNMKYVTQKDVKHTLLLATNPQKNPADTECAQRATAWGSALRAVKVLTSRQILLQPLFGISTPPGLTVV